MYTRKPLTKSQFELSQGFPDPMDSRDKQTRRDQDNLKELTIGLYDLDYAIKYYFDEVIRPEVVEFGDRVKVPVMYGSPEKWKNMQADGYFRDKDGKILSPLIAYKRTSINRNRSLSNKVDSDFPQIYYTQEVKYNQANKYDQFSKLTNTKPIRTYTNTIIPDWIDVTYDVIVWTDYVESMNTITESLIYSEGGYWGDPERFRFRAKIDNFTNTTDLLQDNDRIVRTTFQLIINGHIVPDVLSKQLSKKDPFLATDVRAVQLEMNADATDQQIAQGNAVPNSPITTLQGGAPVSFASPYIQSAPNTIGSLDTDTMIYLNTNKAILASTITVPDTVVFNGSFMAAPAGLPNTSFANGHFTFFMNGLYIEPTAVTSFVDNGNGTCTLVVDTAGLGSTLIAQDEIIVVGKFN